MMVMRYCDDDDEENGHLVPLFYEFLKRRTLKGDENDSRRERRNPILIRYPLASYGLRKEGSGKAVLSRR